MSAFDELLPGAPLPDYDEDAYFRKYGRHPNYAKGEHGSDEFKRPNHITFSNESQYSTSDNQGGEWKKGKNGKWTFKASQANLESHTPEQMQQYFNTVEKGNKLELPKIDTNYFSKYLLGQDDSTVAEMARQQGIKRKQFGATDTRKLSYPNTPTAQNAISMKEQLQPAADLISGFVSGLNDESIMPLVGSLMGDEASLKEMKSRIIPDKDHTYLGMIPTSLKNNASGESAASMEAMSRVKSEATQGVKRYKLDIRSGKKTPLIGVDAVDISPQNWEIVIQEKNGKSSIIDRGSKAANFKLKE